MSRSAQPPALRGVITDSSSQQRHNYYSTQMAQVARNSDSKTSKGGGGAKKQQGLQSKPARQDIDKMVKQVKELVGTKYDDDSIERVLEKNNYDTNDSVEFIFQGNPIPQSSDHNDWQQVTRNSSNKEIKAKSGEKRTVDGNEKKEKIENKPDTDKRTDSRDDKRNEGRTDRKPKKPDVRFKQEGADGAPEGGYRGPRGDRDSKSNGSPAHGRPPRRSSGPVQASPNAGPHRPPQQSQQHPPSQQSPHPQPHANTWGPSAEARSHQASSPQQPPATSTQTPQSSQSQPAPPPSTRPASYSTAALGSVSYSKIVQGNSQPTPPPPQQPQHPPASQPPSHQTQPTPVNPAATSTATGATPSPAPTSTTPVTATPAKQDYSPSPSGSRAHSRASPPPHTAWRPKETSSPTLSATPSAPSSAPIPSATLSSSTAQSTAAPASTPAPSSVPLPAASSPAQQLATQPQAATPQPQTTIPQPTQQQAAPTTQAAPVQTQPAPISPPSSASSQKRQSVVIGGGNLRLPSSLQYDENLSFQFGSMGLDTTKPKDLVLNFGTQPTNTPSPQPLSQTTQPIQPPTTAAQSHLPSTTPPLQQSQPAQQIPQQHTQLAHSGHTTQPAQQHQAAQHAQQAAHPAHVQQHVPTHLPQQQAHLNGEHAGMAGHLVQSPDDLHMQGYQSYLPPAGYFHMPAFGFTEGNPDDRMRSYYEHPTSAGYAATDSSTATSTVPQNSQSPPPQSPSQYPMQSYYYPPYGMHPYYQTSAPTQFSQFPGYNMNYNYNRMGGAGGYPPNVHASSSPAGQSHTAYADESDYSKYLQQTQQQGSYSNFYSAGAAAGSATTSGQGVQQGTGSSVTKPAQSFSPTPTATEAAKSDYTKYGTHRNEPASFYNNMGQQQGAFNQHQQHTFMQQHLPQNMGVPSNQTSAYHHSAQPLSNTSQGQSGGTQRSHYGLP